MTTPTKHILTRITRGVAIPSLLFAAVTPAFGIIKGSFIINADASVTYSYEVDNSSGTFDIGAWALEFGIEADWNQLDAPAGDVTVPNLEWVASEGIPTIGVSAQDFISLGEAGDVSINSTLSGFSFTSSFLPGQITYYEFSATGEAATGQTIGPAIAPVSIPDSGSRGFEALALLSLAALGASRKAAGIPAVVR